jgi:hypothetical protein
MNRPCPWIYLLLAAFLVGHASFGLADEPQAAAQAANAPEASQNAPETDKEKNAPKTRQDAPETDKNAPEARQSVPKAGRAGKAAPATPPSQASPTAAVSIASVPAAPVSTAPVPTTYEIMINGESFLVEADHAAKLESKDKPGTSYQVAIRVAPTQRISMRSFQFTYDLPSKIELDGGRDGNRWAQVTSELGATMILTDLGGPMSVAGCKEELDLLVKSVVKTYEEMKVELRVGNPHDQVFVHTPARGVTIRYQDAQEIEHVCLIYVFSDPKFTAACIIEYLENDVEDVLPVIKKTLDSVQPLAKQG